MLVEKKQEILFKTNELIKTENILDLNLEEVNLYNFLLYNCQVSTKHTMEYEIDRMKIKDIIKDKNKHTGLKIEQMLSKLKKVEINFINNNGDRVETYLITQVKYLYGTDKIQVIISKDLYDTIMNYHTGYTPINLVNHRKCINTFTQWLYENLRMWSGTKKEINFSVFELRKHANALNSHVKYNDFKTRVLNKAIKNIEKNMNMEITIKENKVSKRIMSIDFIVNDKEPRNYNFETKVIETKEKSTKKNLKTNNFTQRNDEIEYIENMQMKLEDINGGNEEVEINGNKILEQFKRKQYPGINEYNEFNKMYEED